MVNVLFSNGYSYVPVHVNAIRILLYYCAMLDHEPQITNEHVGLLIAR